MTAVAMDSTDPQEKPRAVRPPTPTLRLLFSGEAGVVSRDAHVISTKEVPLGRDVRQAQGVGLASDRHATRVHAFAWLNKAGGAVHVRDNDSRNGLFVNGQRVAKAVLRDGDLLRLGDSFVLLRYEPAAHVDAEIKDLIGRAPAVRALRQAIASAGSAATALLSGESGTGKEVVAQALHRSSQRSGKFIACNCAALPEQLVEGQLFGQRAGAFTDARDGLGFFRAAENGTLFLDEVGELPLAIQPKLLRMLQERAVTPLGAVESVRCDVRLVAATNRELAKEVAAGRFRGDLYSRLAVVTLCLPPLRDRKEDILTLLLHALKVKSAPLAPDLVHALLLHPWPYNVREVQSIAEVLRPLLGATEQLELAPVADKLAPVEDKDPIPTTRAGREALLAECGDNKSELARRVGRSRRQIDRWLEVPE